MLPADPRVRLVLALSATVAGASTLVAQKAPNACGLLTSAEVKTLIIRGKETYGAPQTPAATAVVGGKGSVCDYPIGGQVALYVGPNSGQAVEQFLKAFDEKAENRKAVSGVGDKAYVFYPKPRNSESDQGPYLVATVGTHTVTAFLAAKKGQADGPMGEWCRGDQSKMKASEKKDCAKVLADKSETPESLLPAVEELARAVVAKVRAGKFGQ